MLALLIMGLSPRIPPRAEKGHLLRCCYWCRGVLFRHVGPPSGGGRGERSFTTSLSSSTATTTRRYFTLLVHGSIAVLLNYFTLFVYGFLRALHLGVLVHQADTSTEGSTGPGPCFHGTDPGEGGVALSSVTLLSRVEVGGVSVFKLRRQCRLRLLHYGATSSCSWTATLPGGGHSHRGSHAACLPFFQSSDTRMSKPPWLDAHCRPCDTLCSGHPFSGVGCTAASWRPRSPR